MQRRRFIRSFAESVFHLVRPLPAIDTNESHAPEEDGKKECTTITQKWASRSEEKR
jgi:hypothetical protein